MGPLATSDLFRKIVEMTDSANDMGHPRVIVDSDTNISDRTQAILHGGADPLPEMVRAALLLEQAGADVLIMGCNTAHYYYTDICRFVRVPFLNMLEETAKEAKSRGISTVALLATDGTIQSGVYGRAFKKYGVALLTPQEDEQHAVMSMIYDGVKAGRPCWDTKAVTELVCRFAAQGVQAVVLGCTELPIAFTQYGINSTLPLLNPTEILAKQAILAVGGSIRPEYLGRAG